MPPLIQMISMATVVFSAAILVLLLCWLCSPPNSFVICE